ncbi:hypothetical protein SO802_020147 [Lithocarpus litseifolius]|uniref:CCHC-type domain-containing protein n=1 Tax=Lithocarpus litseifolius TaxID=425828 RepID=A0AAW2CAX9_9ROSI
MADNVTSILEKMKLTSEEEEVIEIPEEGRKEGMESCALSLIGTFLTCRPFNRRAAITTLKRAWGLEDGVQMLEVGKNLFQLKFQSEFTMERVLKGGPWSFDNQVLLLTRWKAGMTADNVRFDSVALWVQIWGTSFDLVSPKIAETVGSRLGSVVEVEKKQRFEGQSYFMRVKVAIPIAKPIRRGAFLAGSDGKRHWVTFKYERLPLFCYFCGLLGHDLKHCASYFAATKNEDEVICQYGDWLKAMGGRTRSPPHRKNEREEARVEVDQRKERFSHVSLEAVIRDGEDTVHRYSNPNMEEGADSGGQVHIPVVISMQTAAEAGNENPRITDEVGAEKLGPSMESMQDDDVVGANRADVEEHNSRMVTSKPTVQLLLSGMSNGNEMHVKPKSEELLEQMTHTNRLSMDGVGLSNLKPKSTWTRLNRMEFGFSGLARAITFPTLGKRDMRDDVGVQVVENGHKRGKTVMKVLVWNDRA